MRSQFTEEDTTFNDGSNVAVLIPCYNEASTITKVVRDFKRELPQARIYVYDNNSNDDTAALALDAGAVVIREPRQGKGNVVRQMLRDIEAKYYVLVDGDDTYPAEKVHELLRPLEQGLADHVVGDRLSNGTYVRENKRAFHNAGNDLVCWLINLLYGFKYADVMSGYRAFNHTFAKTLPILSPGFELETELSIFAVDRRWRISQIPIEYRDRPKGSVSKLNTFSDGMKVLKCIFSLFKDYKPLGFFSIMAALFLLVGLAIGIPIVIEFSYTGLVERLPSALVAVAFCGLAALLLVCGLILDTVVKGNRRAWELEAIKYFDNNSYS
ncbi:MAG: glycosyltransferase [Coriobacteriales bacterium]|nr:glycosyltransferase [Coriobacteriales bacterium]